MLTALAPRTVEALLGLPMHTHRTADMALLDKLPVLSTPMQVPRCTACLLRSSHQEGGREGQYGLLF
jgi:hypothetical protein